MASVEPRAPVQVGSPAPDFSLPAVDHEGAVSLADYRGEKPVLLALMRGLWCAFCRRHIEQLGVTREKLQTYGVETLVIVATSPERARLYHKYRATRVPLAADRDLSTHRAYGVQRVPITPMTMVKMLVTRTNPTGELQKPMSLLRLGGTLDRLDGFELTPVDREDKRHQQGQLVGEFLIDRDGIVRWMNVEGAREGLAGIGKFPTDDELLAAARLVAN